MTHLSDRIAAEHRRIWNTVSITCRCGWSSTWPVDDRDVFVAHVADVTERAVRDTIAQQLEVHMRRHDAAQIGFSAIGDAYATAARIAREGTTP